MQYLIVDTSSIVFALSNKVDPFAEIRSMPSTQILISKGVLRELRKLASGRGRYAKYARAAISLLNSNPHIRVEQDSGYVDSWIQHTASRMSCSVCTNDIKLKRALKAKKIKVYSISRDGRLR